jgi:hypothetical protein
MKSQKPLVKKYETASKSMLIYAKDSVYYKLKGHQPRHFAQTARGHLDLFEFKYVPQKVHDESGSKILEV